MKKPFDLTGKVYIVTGSGKGIGKGIVRCFVKSGAKCCINCNSNAAMAEETLKEIQAIGGEDCAFVYQADVSDPEQAKAMVKATYERFGRIDGLVNNAALQKQWMLGEYPLKDYDLLMHVNLGGYINMMQAVLPYLKETKGSVINFASGAGLFGNFGQCAYAAAKEGIRGLTRVAATEWGPDGINVNVVCPLAWTAQLEKFEQAYPDAFKANVKMPPMGHYGDVEKEIGRVCVQLASPDFKYMSGETLTLEGAMGQRP